MQTIENKKILNYILVGIMIWLTIESFGIIIKHITTFALIEIELNEVTIFYSTQFLILLFVFLFTRTVLTKIIKRLQESKSILLRILFIYIVFEIMKYASYLTTPFLVGQSELTSIKYFTELKENALFKTIQLINEYVKIVIVVLTIFLYQKLQNKKMTEA